MLTSSFDFIKLFVNKNAFDSNANHPRKMYLHTKNEVPV